MIQKIIPLALAALLASACTPDSPSAPPPAQVQASGPSVLDASPDMLHKPTFPCPPLSAAEEPRHPDGRTVYSASDGGELDALVQEAEREMMRGKPTKKTERSLEAALRANPESVRLLAVTAMVNAYRGKGKLAGKRAMEAHMTNPNHPYVQLLLGIIKGAQGEHSAAIPHFESSVEMDPENGMAQLLLGGAFILKDPRTLSRSERDAAEAPLTKAIHLDPKVPGTYWNLGLHYTRHERYEMALSLAECGISHLPDNPLVYILHASHALRLGHETKARASLERALDGKPSDAATLGTALFVQAALGGDAEVAALKGRAQKAGVGKDTIAYNLACGHAQGGRQEDGIGWLAKAIKADQKWADIAAWDPDLKPLRQNPDFQTLVPTSY